MDRFGENLKLSLLHYRLSARIYLAVNRVEDADRVTKDVITLEDNLAIFTEQRATGVSWGLKK